MFTSGDRKTTDAYHLKAVIVDEIEQVKARLREEFPGWSIIRSDRGRWWATRGPLLRADLNREASADAGTPEQLAEQIRAVLRVSAQVGVPHVAADERGVPDVGPSHVRTDERGSYALRPPEPDAGQPRPRTIRLLEEGFDQIGFGEVGLAEVRALARPVAVFCQLRPMSSGGVMHCFQSSRGGCSAMNV